jgi:hypothetical protein
MNVVQQSLFSWPVLKSDELVAKSLDFFFGTVSSCLINGIIFILFLTGVTIVLRGRFLVQKETECLDKVRKIFEKADKDRRDDLLDALEEASLPPQRLVVQAIRDVQNVKSLNGNVEIMAESLRAAYVPRSTWGRYIAGILIILGLIGTILGLSQAIVNLRGILLEMGTVVTRHVFQEMISEILGSLSFMETAFSTTLCGFIFFLSLSFLDHWYHRAQELFAREFENFNFNVLIPFFTPKQVEDSLADITHVLKASGSGLVEVSSGITDLVTIVNDNQEIYSQMADTFRGTVDGIIQAQHELNLHYKRVTDSTEAFLELSRELSKEMIQNQAATEQLFAKLSGDKTELEKMYDRVETATQRLEDSFSKGLIEVSGNIKVATDLQNQEIRRIEADHDTFLKNTNARLLQMVNTAEQIFEKQKESYGEDIKRITDAHLRGTESLSEVHKNLVKTLDNGFQNIQREMSSYQSSMGTKFLQGIEIISDKLDTKLGEVLPGISDVVAGVVSQQEKLLKTSDVYVERLKEAIETVFRMQNERKKNEFAEISKDLRQSIQAMHATQEQFIRNLQQGFEQIARRGAGGDRNEGVDMIYFGTVNLFRSLLGKVGWSKSRTDDHMSDNPSKNKREDESSNHDGTKK